MLAPGQAQAASACPGAGEAITAANIEQSELRVLCLVNEYRAGRGVPVLVANAKLGPVARAHSQDMIDRDYFDHENPEGQGPLERAAAAGYTGGVGENIIKGFPSNTPRVFFRAWRKSEGHNRNMLDKHGVRTRASGVGIAIEGGVVMGTQMFGTVREGGTETGLRCTPAKAVKRAEQRDVKRAKKRATRAAKKAKRKGTSKAKRKAKRARKKLRSERKQLKRAKRVVAAACG